VAIVPQEPLAEVSKATIGEFNSWLLG